MTCGLIFMLLYNINIIIYTVNIIRCL